jgi:hypothetical protein
MSSVFKRNDQIEIDAARDAVGTWLMLWIKLVGDVSACSSNKMEKVRCDTTQHRLAMILSN